MLRRGKYQVREMRSSFLTNSFRKSFPLCNVLIDPSPTLPARTDSRYCAVLNVHGKVHSRSEAVGWAEFPATSRGSQRETLISLSSLRSFAAIPISVDVEQAADLAGQAEGPEPLIGSGAEDCASAPSHTTGRAVFRIRRLNAAGLFRHGPQGTLLSVWSRAGLRPWLSRSHRWRRRHRRGDAWPGGSWPQLPRPAVSENCSVGGSNFSLTLPHCLFGFLQSRVCLRPYRMVPCRSTLAVRLSLPSSPPSGTFIR